MSSIGLGWESESTISPEDLEGVVRKLTDEKGNVSILRNGTLLFIKKTDDDESSARELVEEFGALHNFSVIPIEVGGYLIEFHEAVAVFVSESEFRERREEIVSRLSELCLPGEKINVRDDAPEDHALVGVYARGKLRRDASGFIFISGYRNTVTAPNYSLAR